jgi:ATP-binding cassette subfamily B protein
MANFKLPYTKLYKSSLLRVLIGILNSIFIIITAGFSSNIFKVAMKQNNVVFKEVMLFITFVICSQLLILWLENIQNRLESLQGHEFKMKMYRYFIQQKISIINKIGIGGVKERLTRDIPTVTALIVQIIPYIIIGIITGVGYIFYIALLNVNIALILLIISFVQLIPPYIVKKFLERNYTETSKVGEEWMEYIIAGCKGLSTIKMNNLKEWYVNRLNHINKKNIIAYKNTFKTASQEDALNNMISSILTYGTYVIIGLFVLKKSITVDSAIKIIVLSGSFYSVINTMSNNISQTFIAQKAHNRLLDFMSANNYTDKKLQNNDNIFEFKNVSFAYGNNIVLKNLNLQIPRGSSIAVVGKNGMGKSTFIKLLLGIEDDYEGEIKYKGMNIKQISEKQLYESISYVSQEDAEFNISPNELFEITASSFNISNNKIQELAFSLGLSNDNLMAKSFLNLSGGERKKISLIAGLMRASDVYILDEPTNSLDLNTQNKLINILFETKNTLIIISHEENIISNCDYKLSIDENGVNFYRVGGELYA